MIWTVKCMGTKFKGNMITFPKDVLKIISKFPYIPDGNDIYLIINKKNVKLKLKSLLIRKEKIITALN